MNIPTMRGSRAGVVASPKHCNITTSGKSHEYSGPTGLLARHGLAAARQRLTRRFIRAKKLEGLRIHIQAERRIASAQTPQVDSAGQIAELFRDGFPGKPVKEIKKLIMKANPDAFELAFGHIGSGWHEVHIPERTVDLFELWTHLVASLLRLDVRWVDSWYYHVRHGEIHCGTKVLRRPRR